MELITYYVKMNTAFAVFFGIYAVSMRKETGFNARRAWLLGTPLVALALPVLQAPAFDSLNAPSLLLPAIAISPTGARVAFGLLTDRMIMLHGAVTAFLLLALFIRVERTVRALRISTGDAGSFFHRIRMPLGLPRLDHDTILAHEQVHVRERHSLDVLLYEVLSAFCWSMPLWRIALREVRLVHEHIADRQVRSMHPDYPALLLAHGLSTPTTTLQHTFSRSTLKTRIIMLYNERSPRYTRRKLLLAVPALLLSVGLVSWRMPPTSGPSSDAVVVAGTETPAEFPGGMQALVEHLSSKVRYPEQAVNDRVEGTVYVMFTVQADGAVATVKVRRGVRADIDAEAVRVVSELPDWKPAQSNGKAVSSELTLPIAFALPKK